MNPTLTKIIEDWIGSDKPLSWTSYSDMDPSENYNKVAEIHNKALADLRARVPELVEKLEEFIGDIVHNEISAAMSVRDRYQ